MDGDMHVKSAHGMGSTFSFTTLHDLSSEEELSNVCPCVPRRAETEYGYLDSEQFIFCALVGASVPIISVLC